MLGRWGLGALIKGTSAVTQEVDWYLSTYRSPYFFTMWSVAIIEPATLWSPSQSLQTEPLPPQMMVMVKKLKLLVV